MVCVSHPWGEVKFNMDVWIEDGPGIHRPLLRPCEAYDEHGKKVGLWRIPLKYRNNEISRLLIKMGIIENPW